MDVCCLIMVYFVTLNVEMTDCLNKYQKHVCNCANVESLVYK